MTLKGYAGKQLRVQLNDGTIKKEKLNLELLKKYLGGVGYGAKLLYDELAPNVDALSAENKIVFTTGPLTGKNIPGGGSIEVCFKSPLTNLWGESRCGGDFGPELKAAGYDFLIVEGKSGKPVYLLVTDSEVQVKDAGHLLGKTVGEKTEIIREENGDVRLPVMCIGPAGENKVLYSTIMLGDRAAGRCGAGAVMGSKNLLAIAVKGSRKIEAAYPDKFKNAARKAMRTVREDPNTEGFKEHGTVGDIASCDELGDWPTKNWLSNSWGKGEELYKYFWENNLVRNNSCYSGCPVGCGRIVKVDKGKFKTPIHEGAEYESITAFTAFVVNEDMDAAVHSTYLCNEYGIDTISMGAVIAFAMECYEKGLITPEESDNLDLSWGNPEVLPVITKLVAERKGLGNLLADGVMRAAEKLGDSAKELAIHGKGLEAPAHDTRSSKALAVTYGTANRGMCHIHPLEGQAYDLGKSDFGLMPYGLKDPNEVDRWDEKDKGKMVKILQDGCVLPDVLVNCKFMMYCGLNIEHFADIVSGLTGWEFTGDELLKVGERTINAQRMFNVREGCSSADDEIPERMKSLPQFGNYKDEKRCAIVNYDEMLKDYYLARGWDENSGIPTDNKLVELDL
jgi:aldehyde:ferredoxin oxidoreductase